MGLRSLVDQRAFDGRMLIQTRLERDDLLERVPGLQDLPIHVRRPPDERRGLLPWPLAGKDQTPVLHLANGITCRGSLQPLLRALAVENEVALLPCVWTAERSTSGESDASLFFDDPAEPSTAVACSAAVIGVPNRTHSDRLHRLISMVAANRLTPATITDQWEDDLLRYVVAREGGANTRLLSRYVSDARADQAAPKLLNFRPLPSAIRLAAMHGALEAAA